MELDDGLHRQFHRTPAPKLSAMDARSIMATEKRSRYRFIRLFPSGMRPNISWTGNRAVSTLVTPRSLALRRRLTAGLPWTVFGMEDDGSSSSRTLEL